MNIQGYTGFTPEYQRLPGNAFSPGQKKYSVCQDSGLKWCAVACCVALVAGGTMWGLCNDTQSSGCSPAIKVIGQILVGYGLFTLCYGAIGYCCVSRCRRSI